MTVSEPFIGDSYKHSLICGYTEFVGSGESRNDFEATTNAGQVH